MSSFKTMMTLTAAALLAAPALAQDDAEPILDTSPDTVATDFSAADLDQDGALNSDEFVTFAVMRAESGEADYKDLVLGGEYNDKFTMHDADASGGLTLEELGGESDISSDMSEEMEEDTMEPVLN